MWKDRKRILGMPISFTKYSLGVDRLFIEEGFLNKKEDEVLLYRVRDLKVTRTFFQRLLKLGTVEVISTDNTRPNLLLESVKNPKTVKEQIHEYVEREKTQRGVRAIEASDTFSDLNRNGILDVLE